MSQHPRALTFSHLIGMAIPIKIVDIGANPIDGKPPYAPLMEGGDTEVVGFEPNPDALAKLLKMKGDHETYLPYAIGDGKRHTLNFCNAPGMTSILTPNPKVLGLFHMFADWGRVTSTTEIDTMRLDDIAETEGVELIKIDIQGAELLALSNGERRLASTLVIQTEVEFLPMYVGQPLFSEVELFLRGHGFMLHRFFPLSSRLVKPLAFGEDNHRTLYGGLEQLVWADAIFVRDFSCLQNLSDLQLLKMAKILHECYSAYDLVLHLLIEFDRRTSKALNKIYLNNLTSAAAA